MTARPDLLATPQRRRWFFAALYFAEGAPIGYLWWALPVRLSTAGVPVTEVTALAAMLALPWALKFLWAPAVDMLRGPRFGYRAWVVAAQTAMLLTLAPLLWIDLGRDYAALKLLLVAHAVAAATQDVAIDALAIRTTTPAEHGRLNGWMQVGMLLARALFGGALFGVEAWAESVLGWSAAAADRISVAALISAILACLSLVLWTQAPATDDRRQGGAGLRRFAGQLVAIAQRPATWRGVWFALLGGAAFEVVGGLLGPWLVGQGWSEAQVGSLRSVPLVAAMMVGASLGGRWADRWGHRTVLRLLAPALTLAVAGLAAAAHADAATPGIVALLVLIHVLIGAFTAASYAWLMDLTDPDLGATQFSAFMGVTNLCESRAAGWGGQIAASAGYPAAFLAGAAASLLALPALRGRGRANAQVAARDADAAAR